MKKRGCPEQLAKSLVVAQGKDKALQIARQYSKGDSFLKPSDVAWWQSCLCYIKKERDEDEGVDGAID